MIRMAEGARKILWFQRTKQPRPAFMQRIQQGQRYVGRGVFGVLQFRPARFFVRFDRRLLLRECQTKAYIRIHVAIGNVMRHLPHGPAAFAVRRVQLLFGQALYRGAQFGGRLRDRRNCLLTQSRRNLLWRGVLSNRVARIHSSIFLFVSASRRFR